MEEYDFLVVGSGLAGIVLAQKIAAELNNKVLIIDKRNHFAGNCYDYFNNKILVQQYGPHIFHTKNKEVFKYLSGFTKFTNYRHKVIALYRKRYYPIPVNLDTVNNFFQTNFKNAKELKEFLEIKRTKISKVNNSQDAVISRLGKELYEAFIKYYTKKQWNRFPEELDRSVLERLPVKYDQDPYYFSDCFQGMPAKGFTKMFERMLSNANISLRLNTDFFKLSNKIKYKKLIYTGPIDQFFSYKFGKLDYAAVCFDFKVLKKKSFQPNAVINYPDRNVRFYRITEFNKFYNYRSDKTVICTETFSPKGQPCYPVINDKNLKLLRKYENAAKKIKNVIFVGRLAQYKYLNMDQVVGEALAVFKKLKKIR
jgi:UDP-galactopyranose mutase